MQLLRMKSLLIGVAAAWVRYHEDEVKTKECQSRLALNYMKLLKI